MSTFRDILDTMRSIRGEVTDYVLNTRKISSLSKASQDSVLNFPVIVSDALTIEDAGLVSKALEREFASLTLIVMTANPYLTVGSRDNISAADYINRFHQNIDRKTDAVDILSTVQSITNEVTTLYDLDYEAVEGLKEMLLFKIYEGVNHYGVNKENLKYNYTITDVTESSILNDVVKRRITNAFRPTLEARRTTPVDININVNNSGGNRPIQQRGDAARNGNRPTNQLTDNDAKKANELVPTLLHMRIYPVETGRDSTVELAPIDIVIGIKATLHPVSSDEMITNVCRGVKNEDKLFNALRWTTGEISFLKDFVFGINELKLDAINSSHRASKWWSMLKRRKAMAKIKNVILPNKLLPNATLVMTQDEVNTIKEVYGYDLNNYSLVEKLMSNYFLIAFVIVDPALQRVKFLFDGRTQFEMHTYATLAKESTTNDKQFKEMLNMLGRRI